jgi:hypothetical protein
MTEADELAPATIVKDLHITPQDTSARSHKVAVDDPAQRMPITTLMLPTTLVPP